MKSRSRSMVANRTRPSPAMSDDRDEVEEVDRHNGNWAEPDRAELDRSSRSEQRPAQMRAQWNSVPATPAMSEFPNIRPGQSKEHYVASTVKRTGKGKRRQSFPQRTPATRNRLIDDEPMSPAIHAHSAEQQSRMTTARISNLLQREPLRESHGVVAPSIPKMQKPRMAPSAMDTNTKKKSGGICKILSRILQ